jgi:hypothetical protein
MKLNPSIKSKAIKAQNSRGNTQNAQDEVNYDSHGSSTIVVENGPLRSKEFVLQT